MYTYNFFNLFFVYRKTDNFNGSERDKEVMGEMKEKRKNSDYYVDGVVKPNSKFIAEELVKSYNEGKVVYCWFGKQYILNLEK